MKKVQQLCVVWVLCFGIAITAKAQEKPSPPAHAITNVTIHLNNGETIEGGTIVWRNGIIKAVGENVSVPFDAYIIDGGDSVHVYPGFIDGLALWGSPDRPEAERPERPGDPGYKRAGIQPQRNPNKLLVKDDAFEEAEKLGFTTAAIGLEGEMLPGQIEVFFLKGEDEPQLFKKGIGVLAQFEGARRRAYPSTIMGLMAQYKQLFYDAEALKTHINYYQNASSGYPAPDHSAVLEALFPVMANETPFYFEADRKAYIERIYRLQDEFGFNFVLISGKEAYTDVETLKQKDIAVLASFDLPEEPKWHKDKKEEKSDEKKEDITEEQRHFRQRQLEAYNADINNVKKLLEAGVMVGYVSNGADLDEFRDHVLTLHNDGGLSEQQILQVLTENTAEILGIESRVGSLQSGFIANFSVFTEPFLEKETQVWYSVANGNVTEFEVKPKKSKDSEDK